MPPWSEYRLLQRVLHGVARIFWADNTGGPGFPGIPFWLNWQGGANGLSQKTINPDICWRRGDLCRVSGPHYSRVYLDQKPILLVSFSDWKRFSQNGNRQRIWSLGCWRSDGGCLCGNPGFSGTTSELYRTTYDRSLPSAAVAICHCLRRLAKRCEAYQGCTVVTSWRLRQTTADTAGVGGMSMGTYYALRVERWLCGWLFWEHPYFMHICNDNFFGIGWNQQSACVSLRSPCATEKQGFEETTTVSPTSLVLSSVEKPRNKQSPTLVKTILKCQVYYLVYYITLNEGPHMNRSNANLKFLRGTET